MIVKTTNIFFKGKVNNDNNISGFHLKECYLGEFFFAAFYDDKELIINGRDEFDSHQDVLNELQRESITIISK